MATKAPLTTEYQPLKYLACRAVNYFTNMVINCL